MNMLEGGLGAILDEMKKASEEFISVIQKIPQPDFIKIVNSQTTDEDCRSIQTICRHVVRSGYGYADYILSALNIPTDSPNVNKMEIESPDVVVVELRRMIDYNLKHLYKMNREIIEEKMFVIKFITRWGEEFNFEQILEHAIVHILRHRRQVERFIGFTNK